MKAKLLGVVLTAVVMTAGVGCFRTQTGQSKMGVPFSKDQVESRYERSVEQVFAAAREVLAFNGTLTEENTITKTLGAKVDKRTVWIKVDAVEPKVSRIIVQARTSSRSSDIDLASEIDKQIALKLR